MKNKSQQFDPLLILYQIISLQCFNYLALGTLLGLCHALFDIKISLDHFFTSKHLNFVSWEGWMEIFCLFSTALIGAYLLSIIVEKSKKCVDFTFTFYFLHIICCTAYQEFPLDWQWWVVNVLSSVAMASLGEYICATSELEDIPLYSTSAS
eukprot:gene1084-1173_t